MAKLNALDHLLFYCIDKEFQEKSELPDFKTISVKASIKKFRDNKISLIRLFDVSNTQQDIFQLPKFEVDKDLNLMENWFSSLKYVTKLFHDHKVNYILIKVLNSEVATMTDLDMLPTTGLDQLNGLALLDNNGFELYQYRLLAHPLKITATRKDTEIAVDFYPKPMWGRKKVCDIEIISSRQITSYVRGIPVTYPSPEDDLYLFGTHAYYHLRFTLAEIMHAINILKNKKNFDWDYIKNLSLDYGNADAIFSYLKLIDVYSKIVHLPSRVNQKILDEFLKIKICQKINKWLKITYSNNISFPVNLPPSLAIGMSSFYHSKAMFSHESLIDLSYDFLSYFMNLGFKFFIDR